MEQILASSTERHTDRPVQWKLPPLILHPFAAEKGPDRLLEGSRANLALHGLLPGMDAKSGGDRGAMARTVLDGRYQELKMLTYIGRDVQRWAEQCVDFVTRQPELQGQGLQEQSFTTMLIMHPPVGFANKLKQWGIGDPRTIFTRAVGLNSVFDQPPPAEFLGPKFLKSYHRFADYFFICYQTLCEHRILQADSFGFDLYGSDEYAKLLAAGWRN